MIESVMNRRKSVRNASVHFFRYAENADFSLFFPRNPVPENFHYVSMHKVLGQAEEEVASLI